MRAVKLIVGVLLFGLNVPGLARAVDRIDIRQSTSVIDRATGRAEKFPGGRGYAFEVVSMAGEQAVVRIYDPSGAALEGEYLIQENQLPDALKNEIAAGLKAAVSGGPRNKKQGCCDVIDDPQEPTQPTRGPAIAPGARIVYADPQPIPRRAPAPPAARPEPPRRMVASRTEVSLCQKFANFTSRGVPAEPLRQALFFLSKRRNASSQRYVAIADYSQSSRKKRFYLLDLQTGNVTPEKASHGGGTPRNGYRGDPNHDGMLNGCGGSGSGMTRAGFFQTGGYYTSVSRGRYRWPLLSRRPFRNGVKLKGLTPGVNDDAEEDGVVMHEANYNLSGNATMGRSHGCPAFVPGKGAPILAKMVSDNALLYTYAPVCRAQMSKVYAQVRGWENFCK